VASALDFLGVARVELERARRAVSLEELHADDAGASVTNELADDGGFVHGEGRMVKLSPRCTMIAPLLAFVYPLND
jgi:hypothetical protein